ncbi:MAG: right-handed parallel beta-helix repeat-containing protein, partial [Cycloclasticus sp.]|nr:right-handed parallel beta-helix repeat-containing protein [Cycloclasticus sp.]
MKNQYTIRNLVKGSFVALAMMLVTGASGLFAQQSLPNFRVITGTETWSVDQTITSSIIIQSGATLSISNGVDVGFEYVDADGDGLGDLQIIIENGGTLISTGTVNLQASGTNPLLDADPNAANNVHWDGIVVRDPTGLQLSGGTTLRNAVNPYTLEVAGTFTGLSVDGTLNGITISEDGTIIGGGSIQNIGGIGLIVNANNVGVYSYDFTDVDTAIQVNGDNATLKYLDADTLSGGGFVLNGNNATIDWVTAKNGGVGLVVRSNGNSITNSDFDANATSMIVASGADITIDNTFFRNATANGVELAGTAVIDNSSIISSGAIGIDVASGANLTMTNSTDSGHVSFGMQLPDSATVLFNRNNLSGNDRGNGDIQLNTLANAGVQANMQNNWWGVGTRVDTMFTALNAGTVDYTDFRVASQFLFNGADLNITPSITFENFAAGTYSAGDSVNVRYTTTGNVAVLEFTSSAANIIGAAPTVTPNFGNVDLVIDATDAAAGNAEVEYSSSSTASLPADFVAFSPAVAIAIVAETDDAIQITDVDVTDVVGTLIVNATDINRAYVGGTTVRIQWNAPDAVENVSITLTDEVDSNGDANDQDLVIVSSTDAQLGYYDWVVPTGTIEGDGLVVNEGFTLTIADVADGSTVTDGVDPDLDGILIAPSSVWDFTATDNNHTVRFLDVDFASADYTGPATNFAGDGDLPEAGEIFYVGAFYLAADGVTRVSAGYSPAIFIEAAETNATNDGVAGEPITITVYGDDPNTIAKDGFSAAGAGDVIQWRIYRERWGGAAQANQLDANTRIASRVANDGDWAAVSDINYVINGISDATDAGESPSQLVYAEDSGGGLFANQAFEFGFTEQQLDEDAATNLGTAGWFWISSYLNDPTATNVLSYNTAAGTGVLSGVTAAKIGLLTFDATTSQLFGDENVGGTLDAGEELAYGAASTDGGFWYNDAAVPELMTVPAEMFTMLKNGRGDVYWNIDATAANQFAGADIATGAFATAAVWDNLQGYQIRMEAPEDPAADVAYLRFIGSKLTPETSPIALSAGWNLVPNLRGGRSVDDISVQIDQLNISLAMASIADPNIIVKDVNGDIYWPAFGINTIGTMQEGHAYFVYVTGTDELRYPADSYAPKMVVDADKAMLPNVHYKASFNSDNSA